MQLYGCWKKKSLRHSWDDSYWYIVRHECPDGVRWSRSIHDCHPNSHLCHPMHSADDGGDDDGNEDANDGDDDEKDTNFQIPIAIIP